MSLDYHLVDPLGDDEKDEQQSDVLDGCGFDILRANKFYPHPYHYRLTCYHDNQWY
jgi:hypothetical protein